MCSHYAYNIDYHGYHVCQQIDLIIVSELMQKIIYVQKWNLQLVQVFFKPRPKILTS